MNEELNLCLVSQLKMHFTIFKKVKFILQKIIYLLIFLGSMKCIIFSFLILHSHFHFLLKLIGAHMHSNSVEERERIDGERETKFHILGFLFKFNI